MTVVGICASHSPQLSAPPEDWPRMAQRDSRNDRIDFAALAARFSPGDLPLGLEDFRQTHQRCQEATQVLADAVADFDPDLAVIIGDDQRELFRDEITPAVTVFCGKTLVDDPEEGSKLPAEFKGAMWARHAEQQDTHRCDPAVATSLAEHLVLAGFDISVSRGQLPGRSLGHAFTFPRLRLGVRREVPTLAVFVNTYYPPNQPPARRCLELGEAIGDFLSGLTTYRRIAVFGSGGLSHIVIDEELDRLVLDGLQKWNPEALAEIGQDRLQLGTSEIRNWLVVGAALRSRTMQIVDYVPAYRSAAGTGCGMGFALWR